MPPLCRPAPPARGRRGPVATACGRRPVFQRSRWVGARGELGWFRAENALSRGLRRLSQRVKDELLTTKMHSRSVQDVGLWVENPLPAAPPCRPNAAPKPGDHISRSTASTCPHNQASTGAPRESQLRNSRCASAPSVGARCLAACADTREKPQLRRLPQQRLARVPPSTRRRLPPTARRPRPLAP